MNLSTMLGRSCRFRSEVSPARLNFGRGLENQSSPLLRGDQALALQMSGGERPLSQLLSEVETTKGRKRLLATLRKRPYPHYRPVPDRPDLICRIEEDGTETVGRFVGREFKAHRVGR
jgi:hypothetical protein